MVTNGFKEYDNAAIFLLPVKNRSNIPTYKVVLALVQRLFFPNTQSTIKLINHFDVD